MPNKYYKLLFFSTLIVIMTASLIPHFFPQEVQVRPDFSFRLDYLLHFSSYLLLGFFLTGWKCYTNKRFRIIIFIVFFGLFFSAIFEFIQYYLPTRTFNPYDMISNFAGYMIGFVVGVCFLMIQKNKRL